MEWLMTNTLIGSQAGTLRRVERALDAHLRSLRRKLKRAGLRGEPVDRLQARIRSEEDLLRQMRAYGVRNRAGEHR
jgi:hypothetical protein